MASLASPLAFLAGVVMGTGSTITVKVLYGLQSVGLTGADQFFEKPLFLTLTMFVAMTIALPVHWCIEAYRRSQRQSALNNRIRSAYEPLNVDELSTLLKTKGVCSSSSRSSSQAQSEARPLIENASALVEALELEDLAVPWRTYFLLAIPSTFDLLGTGLASIGLLFTTVSVYQLVRCSVIIVCALLKGTVLHERLSQTQWIGIGINTLAMLLVSMTSWFPDQNSGATAELEGGIARDPRLGIAFIIASCLVQGSQYVFEERVMTVDNAPPLVVVGMEGVWGTLMMILVVFPWAYLLPGTDTGGCLENIDDSILMVRNSPSIQYVLLAFTLTVFAYNVFCIYVTFLLSSIWHAILDNFRPISVWMTDLVLYYFLTERTFGERWTEASWLELVGMLALFVGTAVYNGSIRLPGFEYEPIGDYLEFANGDLSDGENDRVITKPPLVHVRTPTLDISSPSLTRSPLITRQIARSSPHIGSSVSSSYGSRDMSRFEPPHLSLISSSRGGPLSSNGLSSSLR